jgi:hypothetical protein
MIDGGPNNLLGTFLIVSYSAAYTTLTVVVDGNGQRASMQVDNNPFVSTDICTGGAWPRRRTTAWPGRSTSR